MRLSASAGALLRLRLSDELVPDPNIVDPSWAGARDGLGSVATTQS
jgi:hypothetical protein